MNRIGGMTTCWGTKKDKKVNKETAFIRNGSKLLEKLVDICDGKCNSMRRFSATELEKATNNYDPRKLLINDFSYKLYKGFLQSKPVSVKKFKDDDEQGAAITGTSGLFGPEYLATGNFNEKQDVFNIGVFLLVLLSGQTVYNISRPEEEIFLLDHVKKCMADDRLNKAIDSTIIAEGAWPGKEQQLQAFAALALRCISEVAEDRPSMIDVSKELRKMHRNKHDHVYLFHILMLPITSCNEYIFSASTSCKAADHIDGE
ncbi:hypothetical protein OIU77_004477 [Salix suchowensis]|uniref:Protein kinase domain-containing protein n=1 Tax=Salix suchowensis TaxID=1278906 RepID=A0ABQ9AUJ0_9ROSI|nr:hypothetical protein OIU77_004477 [Salix suchowensis]